VSPVVRVRAGAPRTPALELPGLARSLPLSLGELVAAARAAGDVPLPFGYDATGGRLATRLAAGDRGPARLREALDEARPGGPADASLADRGLLVDGSLVVEPAAALHVLAGGSARAVVDVVVHRGPGASVLHCWLGVEGRLVARLATRDGLAHELGWHDTGLWSRELARVAALPRGVLPATGPGHGGGPPRPLPTYASLPTDLLVAAAQAVADGRPDLVDALVAQRGGPVRTAGPHPARDLDDEEATALVRAVLAPSARLRVVAEARPDVTVRTLAWLGLVGAWHELMPGGRGTAVLRRRSPEDLGGRLAPLVTSAGERR